MGTTDPQKKTHTQTLKAFPQLDLRMNSGHMQLVMNLNEPKTT